MNRTALALSLACTIACSRQEAPKPAPAPAPTVAAAPEPEPTPAPVPAPAPAPPPPVPGRACLPYWKLASETGTLGEIGKAAGVTDRWVLCDLTHEKLTRETLRQARRIDATVGLEDPRVWEHLRGVQWNDDPEGLFYEGAQDPKRFASKPAWLDAFRRVQQQAAKGRSFGPSDSLLARSHFGDLQFLHARAGNATESIDATRAKIYSWIAFTYEVATGVITPETKLKDVKTPGIAALFPRQADWTVARLFNADKSGDLRARALGSLLHVVQDAWAPSNVERSTEDETAETIVKFHTVVNGEHPHHRTDEGWWEAWADGANLGVMKHAGNAIIHGGNLVEMAVLPLPLAGPESYVNDHLLR